MNTTTPKVFVLAYTANVDHGNESTLPNAYQSSIGLTRPWSTDAESDGEALIETAGRLCYRSWEPGVNKNVTKVREGNHNYLGNILEQRHGSVLRHVNVTFLFHGVSRVFTHELVRHGIGTAVSQESLRYVRLDENSPMVLPPNVARSILEERNDAHVHNYSVSLGGILKSLTDAWKLDDPKTPFSVKKAVTSALRRFIGMGVATDLIWTANIQTLRHVLEMRSDASSVEWEMLEVFGRQVGPFLKTEYPALFQDFVQLTDDSWTTYHRARALCVLKVAEYGSGAIVDSGIVKEEYRDQVKAGINESTVKVPESWVKGWAARLKGNQ
jgi:thymidylate synthase (FAD)